MEEMKTERGQKCREEALEGLRLIIANSKKRVSLIKQVLETNVKGSLSNE